MNIKVGHINYDYKEVDYVDRHELLRGQADYISRTIKIDKNLDNSSTAETVLHELIHTIDDFMVIGLEEEQVEQLGAGLTMLFKDNKQAMQELFLNRLQGD